MWVWLKHQILWEPKAYCATPTWLGVQLVLDALPDNRTRSLDGRCDLVEVQQHRFAGVSAKRGEGWMCLKDVDKAVAIGSAPIPILGTPQQIQKGMLQGHSMEIQDTYWPGNVARLLGSDKNARHPIETAEVTHDASIAKVEHAEPRSQNDSEFMPSTELKQREREREREGKGRKREREREILGWGKQSGWALRIPPICVFAQSNRRGD